MEIEAGGEKLSVTLSIGGTVTVRGDTPAEMLRRADTLMYQSSLAGRNRVTITEPGKGFLKSAKTGGRGLEKVPPGQENSGREK
ncbi:hypothetical protein MASR1M66_20790 [Aminivibrio sp.]